jgi:hypothetical protein
VFISKGGKAGNVGFGVFVGFNNGSVCHQAVETNARVEVDVVKGNQVNIFGFGWVDRRDTEEFMGRCGCKEVACTSSSLAWPLRMAFSSGWAWFEILGYPMGHQVGTLFEVATSDCIE